MQDVNLSNRYIKAYVGHGNNQEQINRLEELKAITQGLLNNQNALDQLTSAAVSKKLKEDLINKVIPSNHSRCFSLFKLLINKNRMYLIEKFELIIMQMVESRLNEKSASIDCNSNYSESEKKKIETIIENKLNVKINSQYHHNGNLIGGFKAIVGNQMIDCSIKHILTQFKENALSKT